MYIKRSLEPVLKKAAGDFPVIVLTGPRQSGKTTLLKRLFGDEYRYVSLELPDIRLASIEDPRAFLDQYRPPVIIDEVQHAPDLLSYIREAVDANRSRAGQFLLAGSQDILLSGNISDPLAGRAAVLRLMPLSWREEDGCPSARLPWEKTGGRKKRIGTVFQAAWSRFLRGGYPELAVDPKRDVQSWHSSYIQTYLERDVRSIRQVGDLTQFQIFLRILAAHSTRLLNLADLSRETGVSLNTVKSWISVLEATHQVYILRPYHADTGKRLVKTPRVYFSDTGILCHLTGIRDPGSLAAGPMSGPVLETAVLGEILKTLVHRGSKPRLYFWKTSAGSELDIVVEYNGKLVPIEVNSSATPRPSMGAPIRSFRADIVRRVLKGYVIHPGDIDLPLGVGVTALPLAKL